MAQGLIKPIIRQTNYHTIPDGRTFVWGAKSVAVGGHTGTIWGSANTGLYIHSMEPTISFGVTFLNTPYIVIGKAGGSGAFVTWVRVTTTAITAIDFVSPVQTPTSGSEYIINYLAIGYKSP